MNATLPLHTGRLTLRELEDGDWEAVHHYASDYEVVRFMPWGPNTEDDTKAFIARAMAHRAEQPRTAYELAVVRNADGRLIGGCGLRITDAGELRGSIGYCFSREVWGRGYATEVARALLGFGFEALGLHRIGAACDADNLASARVLEKAGMLREGRLREHQRLRGRWRDSFLYGLLDREWDRLQTAGIPCPATRRREAACAPA